MCLSRFRRTVPVLALLAFLPFGLLFSGCGRGGADPSGSGPIDRAASSDAAFAAVFPSASNLAGDVRCAGEKRADGVTLTVLSPARSAGIVISLALAEAGRPESGFTVTVSGPDFPAPAAVDPAAARALTDVFAALYGYGGTDSPSGPAEDEEGASCLLSVKILPAILPAARRSDDDRETAFCAANGTRLIFGDGGAGEAVPVRIECPDLAGGIRTVLLEDYRFLPPAP